jgi:DNA gyrase subunit A
MEKIKAMVPYSKDDKVHYLFFVTKNGIVKRTEIAEFENINRNGKIAIKMNEDDELAFVKGTTGEDEIIIAGSNGKAVRFEEKNLRPLGRSARGVNGFNTDGSTVVGMATNKEGQYILTVSENGFGKKSPLDDYRMTNRGAKGVRTLSISDKTGNLVCMKAVNGDEDCMIMTNDGIIIRISLTQVSTYGRSARGVKVINVNEDQKVSTVAVMNPEAEEGEAPETDASAEAAEE